MNFGSYRNAIAALPTGPLTQQQLLTDEYLIGREGSVQLYYVPFDRVATDARVILVGVTPGWKQMRLAFETCRDALIDERSDDECLLLPKQPRRLRGCAVASRHG